MKSGLQSDYVEELSKVCVKNEIEVLPCDVFSKLTNIKLNNSYIINLDPSHLKGSHYVGIYVQHKSVLYFDSMGLPCTNKYILNGLMRNQLSTIYYSSKRIQGGLSLFCGYFTISFHIMCGARKKSLEEFISLFEEDKFEENEQVCVNIIKEQISKK